MSRTVSHATSIYTQLTYCPSPLYSSSTTLTLVSTDPVTERNTSKSHSHLPHRHTHPPVLSTRTGRFPSDGDGGVGMDVHLRRPLSRLGTPCLFRVLQGQQTGGPRVPRPPRRVDEPHSEEDVLGPRRAPDPPVPRLHPTFSQDPPRPRDRIRPSVPRSPQSHIGDFQSTSHSSPIVTPLSGRSTTPVRSTGVKVLIVSKH